MNRINIKLKSQPPLRFSEAIKEDLYWRLKRYDEIKYLRWYKDKSYLRFYIYDNAYQIIVSPLCKPFEHIPVSYNGGYVIMAGYAAALKIDVTKLGYDYINRGDKGFSISHSDDFDKVLDNFVDKYMDHFKTRNGKFDVELQIVKLMAGIMFDHQVDEREKQLRKKLQQ